MNTKWLIAAVLGFVTAIGLYYLGLSSRGVTVTAAEFGAAWPLTVAEAHVKCQNRDELLVNVGGVYYALNGSARQAGRPEPRAFWKPNPQVPGTFMSLHPLAKRAEGLCD